MVSSEKTSKSGFNISVSGTLDTIISETASIMSTLIEKVIEERPELARIAFIDMVHRATCFIEEKTGIEILDGDLTEVDDDNDDDSGYVSDKDMEKLFTDLFGGLGCTDDGDDSTVDDLPKYLF